MSETELRYPGWQASLQEVIVELDCKKLPEKIEKVETQIFDRLQQLRQHNDGDEEDAISYALTLLRMIKSDRLGYPDWK